MLNLNDDEFEAYLKKFRPEVPDALPRVEPRRSRSSLLKMCAASAVAAMVIVGVAGLRYVNHAVIRKEAVAAETHVAVPATPLTMRKANALLATSPSYRAAVDSMVFPAHSSPMPKDRRSALEVLAKEKVKL